MQNNRKSYQDKRININSFLVAAMLCCNSMAVVIKGFNGIVVLTVVVLALFNFLYNNKRIFCGAYSKSFVLTIILLIAFLLNMLVNGSRPQLMEYFEYFLVFGVPFLFLPIDDINFRKVLLYISYASLFLLPFYLTYDYHYSLAAGAGDYEDTVLMTMTYRLLPLVVANTLVGYDIENKVSKKWKFISVILAVVYFTLLIVISSRGAIVALAALAMFLLSMSSHTLHGKRIRIALCIIGGYIFVNVYESAIEYLYDVLNGRGINILAIDRMYFSMNHGGTVDSGRSTFYQMAIDDFLSSPLWGCGIASFNNFSGCPHNLLLHVFSEGGLLFAVPFFVLSIKSIKELVQADRKYSYSLFLIFVFCSGIIQLMFSFFYWGSQFFWIFVFLILYRSELKKVNYKY